MERFAGRWWLAAVALVVAVLAVTLALYRSEAAHHHAQQAADARQANLLLSQSVQDVLGRERALASVLATLPSPASGRWQAFANVVTDQAVASAAGFITPVSESDRSAFERRTGLRLVESPRPGVVRAAAPRALHLVLTQSWQKTPGVTLLGLDLAANTLRRSLLLAAARTGKLTATPPVQFLGPSAGTRGVIIFAPVRTSRGVLRGWVVASYRAEQLAAMVTSHMHGVRLAIADGGEVLVAGPRPAGARPSTVDVAGRRWSVWATVPGGASYAVAWLVLGFGLCLAAAIGLILRQSDGSRRIAAGALAEREAEAVALQEIATLVAQQALPEEVFALVARKVGVLLDSRTAAVSRFQPERNQGIIVGGWTADGIDLTGEVYALDGVTASAAVFRTGVPATTPASYESDSDPIASLMSMLAGSSGIAAPIVVGGRMWGALGAAYSGAVIPAGASAGLERFAQLVALAISNADAWDMLAHQAASDPLTAVANRRAFDDALRAELARARRYDRALSLVLLDIDHFKAINDEHGHPVGDQVLVAFARLLSANAREGELIARIGGEEFAWLMPETDRAGACAAAERVRTMLEGERFVVRGAITVSAGVCTADGDHDPPALVRDADQALYRAKQGGRNRVAIHGLHAAERELLLVPVAG